MASYTNTPVHITLYSVPFLYPAFFILRRIVEFSMRREHRSKRLRIHAY